MDTRLTDFDFRMRPPTEALAETIEFVWYARGRVPYDREQISPTGSTVAVIVLGDPIRYTSADGSSVRSTEGFLAGPSDRPAVNEPLGETFAVGMVTTTVGCEPIFGATPGALRGGVVDLGSAWPRATALRSELLDLGDPDAMLDHVLVALEDQQGGVDERRRRCARWVAELEADPVLAIGTLAEREGITHSHLVAEFGHHVGITPRMLARLLRMRAVIAAIDIEPDAPWADIAARHGWFDQAHFIRDFKRHTGVTPSAYVAAQQASFLPGQEVAGSGVGFVPEI